MEDGVEVNTKNMLLKVAEIGTRSHKENGLTIAMCEGGSNDKEQNN
jgi:hypothetical protein